MHISDENSVNHVNDPPERAANKTCQAIALVKRIMVDQGCAMYDGEVYKKVRDGKFTFIMYKSLSSYVMGLLSDVKVADVLVPHIKQIIDLLSDPECGMVKQLVIDFNFIECQPFGYCFNIEKKCFEKDPKELKGSPRAFVYYEYSEEKEPSPKYFVPGAYCLKIFSDNAQIQNFSLL